MTKAIYIPFMVGLFLAACKPNQPERPTGPKKIDPQEPRPSRVQSDNSSSGLSLYVSHCQSCHGAAQVSSVAGASVSEIKSALANQSAMKALKSKVSNEDIQKIAEAIASNSPKSDSSSNRQPTLDTEADTEADIDIGSDINPKGQSTQIQQTQSLSGIELYDSNCSSCHNSLAQSTKKGRTALAIENAISSQSQMKNLEQKLTESEVELIAAALVTSSSTSGPTQPLSAATQQNLGSSLYTKHCQSCHGALGLSSKTGRTATQITNAIQSQPNMASLKGVLSAQEISDIAQALASVLLE